MPRIVPIDFTVSFEQARDELVPVAKRLIVEDHEGFAHAGKAIDTEFSIDATRQWASDLRAENAKMLASIPEPPGFIRTRSPLRSTENRQPASEWFLSGWHPDPNAGNELRAARLRMGVERFAAANRSGLLDRALGKSLPKGEREHNARRAILLTLAITDPNASDYIRNLTDIGRAPWRGDLTKVPPVLGRADVCRVWGHDSVTLLREAVCVLDPSVREVSDGSIGTSLLNMLKLEVRPKPSAAFQEFFQRVEVSALRRLAERDVWAVDQLPSDIDVDMLRCLDDSGWVEARAVIMQHGEKPGSPRTPAPHQWVSPIRQPTIAGEWKVILSKVTRSQWEHPFEVRVSERGRAELARWRRGPVSGQAGGDSDRPDDSASGVRSPSGIEEAVADVEGSDFAGAVAQEVTPKKRPKADTLVFVRDLISGGFRWPGVRPLASKADCWPATIDALLKENADLREWRRMGEEKGTNEVVAAPPMLAGADGSSVEDQHASPAEAAADAELTALGQSMYDTLYEEADHEQRKILNGWDDSTKAQVGKGIAEAEPANRPEVIRQILAQIDDDRRRKTPTCPRPRNPGTSR